MNTVEIVAPIVNQTKFQVLLSDHCWRCRKEPACARMVILQDYGESVGIVETESGYQCDEYERRMV